MAKTVLISDNSSSLLLAYFLQKRGDEVIVVDTEDRLNPSNLRSSVQINTVPAREETLAGFRHLEQLLNTTILSAAQSAEPLLAQGTSTMPFVGFGESKSTAVYPLSQYNYSQFHSLLVDWPQLMQEVRSELSCTVHPFSELTGLEAEGDQISCLTINGNQKISGDQYIFHCDPRLLTKILPSTELSSRVRSRLLRSTVWSRLAMQFQHEKSHFDGPQLLFLPSSNLEDPPLVGRFEVRTTNDSGPLFFSTWETYIQAEEMDDPEQITTLIKALKRRIRRAFPEFEERSKEALNLDDLGYGDFAWTREAVDFNNLFDNLTVTSPLLTNEVGLAQMITSAHQALTAEKKEKLMWEDGPSLLSSNPL